MNELMPCPFCGNAKNLAMVNEKHDHSGGYFIACPECGASTIMRYAMGDDPKPLLIEAWNRRAALAAQPEAVGGPTTNTVAADLIARHCKPLDEEPGAYDEGFAAGRIEDAVKIANRLAGLYKQIEDLTRDRDGWKQEHENLLFVRQQDLALLAAISSTPPAQTNFTGWRFVRNSDGSIGIFAPPPAPGKTQRTSGIVTRRNLDTWELLGRLADAPPAQAQDAVDAKRWREFRTGKPVVNPDYRDGWNACWYAIKNDTIAQPPTEAVRMSEAEIGNAIASHIIGESATYNQLQKFARAIEQATAARLGVKMGDV